MVFSVPQVEADQISASYIKNSDRHASLNKVETDCNEPVPFTQKLTGRQSIIFLDLFALSSCSFF
jgi:hypothetical protein